MLLLLETIIFLYNRPTQNLIGNITPSSVIAPVAAVNKAQQSVCKCSLTFHLKDGIVIFYENCTNKYGRVDKLRRGGIHPLGT